MRTFVLTVLVACAASPTVQGQVLPGAPDAPGEEAPPPIATVEAVPDTLLQRRIQAVFGQIDEFERVRVSVSEGVVRLQGAVVQTQASENAAALAERFEGVLYVDNDIEAETDVETRVTPAIERIQEYINGAVRMLPVLGVALLVLLLFGFLARLLDLVPAPKRLGVSALLWGLIRRVLRAVIFFIGFVLALDILGITALVGAALGTAGVVGLAIGFAFQDIVENYLAGALMSIRQPFSVNDAVRVNEHEGNVVRLTSRETLLLTMEGNHVRIPNATVFKSTLINYTRNPRRLFYFDAGIDVEEELGHAMAIGVETLDAMRGVLEDPPPFARVQSLGDSNVIVRYHAWVDQRQADFFKVQSEAIRLVKKALDEAGVIMPEPIYQIRLRQLEEAEKPSRSTEEGPPAAEQARQIEVAPDGKLEAQVEEDLSRSGEENLLQER